MNIHEYQAKAVLREFGVPAARGGAFQAGEAEDAAKELAARLGGEVADPCRRPRQGQIQGAEAGAKGGVRLAKSIEEVADAGEMLGRTLVTKQTGPQAAEVKRLYVEEGAEIARELYLSALVDRGSGRVAFIASNEGGMDIEEVAHNTPEKIVTISVDPATGVFPHHGRALRQARSASRVPRPRKPPT